MTVFDDKNEQPVITPDPAAPLENLVGEGKKFATVEDLAKGKEESDKFIEQLKGEVNGLREDLDKRLTSEQVLEEINRRAAEAPRNEENTSSQTSVEDISEVVRKVLTGEKDKETTESNVATANNKMVEIYGADKASEMVTQKASELGVGVDFLKDAAAKSPDAFFKLLGVDAKATPIPAAQSGGENTEGLHNKGPEIKAGTMEAYSAMRKSDPKQYWSPKTQREMFELKKTELNNS